MPKKLSEEELSTTIKSLFAISEAITSDTDLSRYIKDSIDLGELIAVVKEQYDITVSNVQLFKTHSRFSEVLKIFNNEL
jgi:acyl carrier protein